MHSRLIVAVAGLVAAVGCGQVPVEEAADDSPSDSGATQEPEPEAPGFDPSPDTTVQTFEVPSSEHVTGTYDYPQTPPAGGPHNQVWQTCGFYSEPVVAEHAVHSLEHGAVWITYDAGLPADQVDVLHELAATSSYVLVSPYDGLPSPVVASAWGVQVRLPSAADPALNDFLVEYVQGPQTPEPGATCSSGIGVPDSDTA